MYVAEQFALSDEDSLALVDEVGVGDFVTQGLDATYLPFERDGDILTTHVGRTNAMWRHEGEALVIVHGPDAYVGMSAMPPQDPNARLARVPTWDYITVHLHGRFVAHHDREWNLAALGRLVARHEDSWRMGDQAKIEAMLPALVGIEFHIEQIGGKAKLNQNLSSEQIGHVADALERTAQGEAVARAIRRIAVPYARERERRVREAAALHDNFHGNRRGD